MDTESPQHLSDQELLNRLRELGDSTTKAVTPKNRQILEKKMNHLVAAVRKKEREALAAATARSRSPRRTPASSTKAKLGRVIKSNVEALVGASNQNKPSEFSDSDIDRSPSRNRRSNRKSFNPDTSSSKQPQNGGPRSYQGNAPLSPQENVRSSRKSSGVNTSYNLDETLLDLETHNFQVKDKQIRPLENTPDVNNRTRPSKRSSTFSKGDTNVDAEVHRTYESTRYSDYVTAEPTNSILRNQRSTESPTSASAKEKLKTFRCSKLSFLFFAVIVASIAIAIYFREPCVGEHCASYVKVEDRLKKMSAIAANVMGSYECGYSTSKDLRIIDMTFDREPLEVLKFALENEASGITFSILASNGDVISAERNVGKAERIRSLMSSKTPWCRFRQSFAAVTMALFYLILGVFGIVGLVVIVKIYLYRRKKYMKRVDELVRGIILTAKAQAAKNPPYIPIAHVRDRLLTSEEKKCNNRIWDRAVTFLSNSESRLRTENQIIKGEEYMVWHWVSLDDDNESSQEKPKPVLKNETHELLVKPVPITVTNVTTTSQPVPRSDPESIEAHPRIPTDEDMEVPASQSRPTSKLASVGNPLQKGRKSITLGPCSGWSNYDRSFIEIYPPTRCLKLKNLALVETGNSGLDIAKASVIERIKRHKFNVYSVDCDHRSEETAVYICCVDNAQAADIYKLFFEQKYNGETVQVKFLKLEKYLERFPFLRNCVGLKL